MKDQSSTVSVAVVNHNAKHYLEPCLNSVLSQTFKPLEIIVVDNASRDDSMEMLKSKFPSVVVVSNSENRFFSESYNQCIRNSKGDYILCLNNDVILDKNFLLQLMNKKDLDGKIGMWGGKILRLDRETIDSAGLFLSKERKPIERGYGVCDVGQFNQDGYVFGVGGAVVLFSSRMLEDVKINNEYFDEDFKIYYEDLDLCWRAHNFGWKAYYVSSAIGYHRRGGTAHMAFPKPKIFKRFYITYLSSELTAHLAKNRYSTIIKNETLSGFIKNFIFIVFYDIMLWVYILCFRPKATAYLFKNRNKLNAAFRKRRQIFKKLLRCEWSNDLSR
ncbi:glycosyltransferase family 2 protein [Thermoproteota archaeon]